MKKILMPLIAVAMLLAGQAFAEDKIESIAASPSLTKEQLAEIVNGNTTWIGTVFRYCYYEFQPEEDITAYELVICMKFMHRDYGTAGPPEQVQRHFREVCQ